MGLDEGCTVNADSLLGKTGAVFCHNVFAYCANNPITAVDENGNWFMLLTAAIGAVAGAVVGGVVAISQGAEFGSGEFWRDAGVGAAAGGLVGLGAGVASSALLTGSALSTTAEVLGAMGYGTVAATTAATTAAIKAGAEIGTNFGKLGVLIENPKIVVDWSQSIIHGIQKMQERGVTQEMVNNWVGAGKALQQSGGQYLFATKEGVAVVSAAGKLITAYPSAYFDAAM